ncbi:MAG: hypothetical protein A4E67_00189 [Syntrophaceae bacterium PtaB.Bin038]|nr:MAG: hypothetical protein A4E67_00189 [Syntrophaceae bacterium PtaB.Bin038]
MPNIREIMGLRRSPSMSRTRLPPWAIVMARLTMDVVLPSSGEELVRTIVLMSLSRQAKARFVRMAR